MAEAVQVVSTDEVCQARGQNSLTIISEPKEAGRPTRGLLTVGVRDSGTLREFADHMRRRVPAPERIGTICPDMRPVHRKGFSEQFGGSLLVFD